ncbi:MAG TPA: CHAT domain-containing protein, partial [Thermoanaerobaculia bacterium]|nr:CHAT domain-containing protein [Thermoanaerobaculia bacterium]
TTAPSNVAEIQRSLPAGTLVLEYCVLDDVTYVWTISRDGFEVTTLKVGRKEIDRWTRDVQASSRTNDITKFESATRAAYARLIVPVLRKGARRLVFIPDGAMHGLPFAALQDASTRKYLIETAPIEVAGSMALYLYSLAQNRALQPPRNPSILLLGNPTFDRALPFARDLEPLAHAEEEVREIAKEYGSRDAPLVREQATVAALLDRARDADIVHIAAHAIVTTGNPSRSMILLAKTNDDSGVLDAEPLLTQLKLNHTRLFVLSTCSSAGGSPVGPEGVAPLVRPLLTAGVPAVIGSLWNVGDATAKELLVSFHRAYRQSSDAAVAMQVAQAGLLRNSNAGLSSVFAWAPFQVIGHAAPNTPANNN